MKKANESTEGGNTAFEDYYKKLYGDRWPGLRQSLLLPAAKVPLGGGLLKPYMMDRASILAAASLRLPAEGTILDACAAPGGKTLVLASRMEGGVRLLSNELSGERRRRLAKVLDEYLDPVTRARVNVSGFDAAAAGGRKSEWNRFDAVLLDAPCSSERHVIQSPAALGQWRPSRPRSLAQRQWSLLSAAYLLLKPGGSLVYITCALTPEENDGSAARLLEKYSNHVEPDEPDFSESPAGSDGACAQAHLPPGEKTLHGRIILPDVSDGMGPMYVARFRKV